MRFRGTCSAALAAITMIAGASVASAQEWPTRPVTIIVPFGAGGPTDTLVRLVAQGMRGPLGQPVVIENVVGASGTIGTARIARASPDGYTLGLGNFATHVLNGPLFALSYDLFTDFEPVGLIAREPVTIVARKTIDANTLMEFITWLRANSERATQGTTGAGGISTVGGALFQRETGTRFRSIPYRSGLVGAMQDLVAGQIDFMIDTAANTLPQWRAGAIKAYAVASKERLPAAADLPTAGEAGLPTFSMSAWHAFFSPKGTPKDIIAKLNAAAMIALADPNVRRRLVDFGFELFPPDQLTPEALGRFHRAETEKWWPIIKAADIRAE
jgi:tripartite-type tricarboxylate transporter receptor subunit TctC